jgi:hypothetical protein
VAELEENSSRPRPAPGNVFVRVHLVGPPERPRARDLLGSILEDWDGRKYEMIGGRTSQSRSGHNGLFGGWKETYHPDRYQVIFEIPRTATPRAVTVPQTIDVPFPGLQAARPDRAPRILRASNRCSPSVHVTPGFRALSGSRCSSPPRAVSPERA